MTFIENLRSYKVHHIALFDVSVTILGSCLLWFWMRRIAKIKISFLFVMICVFLLGIVAHRFLGIRTTVDKFLFPVK